MRKLFVIIALGLTMTASAKKEKGKKVLTPTELVSSLKWSHEAGQKTDVAALDEILVAGDSLYANVQKLVGGMTFYDVKKIAIAETGDTIVAVVDEQGNIPHLTEAFMADAIGTAAGAMLGTSTVTTYVESASGVNAGGRSGLTSFTTAICFVLALFLAPLFLAIPAQATAPALVLVGVMMMTDVSKLHLGDFADAVPAFVCIALMPLTYSISDGILMGLITYVLLRIFAGRYRELKLGMIVLAVLFVLKYALL